MQKNYIKSTFIFLLIITFAVTIDSQAITSNEFDLEYLESLPEDVKDDILKESQKLKEDDKNNLKPRPSSELLKLDVVKNWEEFQRSKEKKSERYGVNLFRTMQSSFMPINEPNFGNNYILDYGDFLEIETFNGDLKNSYIAEIKRDGSVSLDDLGPITVAGLNFDQAVELIKDTYEKSFIGSNVVVNLDKIRDIKILITGNVEFPGLYTLSGNSNVLQALNIAGGVSENGSLREVILNRNGKEIIIDVYKAIILGDISELDSLQSGDSLYISPVKNLVRAGSGFNNEAVFELRSDETLNDLITYSGGIKKSVSTSEFTLIREDKGKSKTIILSMNDLKSTYIKNLDSVYLPTQDFGFVELSGEVNRPGKYTIYRNDDIYELIKRAGGYTSDAYPFGGVFMNNNAKDLEKEFMMKTYKSIITYIVQNPSQAQSNMNLPYLLNEIKNTEPSGRLVVEFDMINLSDNPKSRILLNDKDRIHIPKMQNTVYVYGDVVNPSAITFNDNFTVNDYINGAGGISPTADNDSIIIVAPNGKSEVVQLRKIFKTYPKNMIYPGSLIFVPKEVGKRQGIDFYATAAPIFSSLALSVASLNSINN